MPQPRLPQNEPNLKKRNEDLNRQRQAYEYDYTYLDPLVLLKKIPAGENFSAQYIAERTIASAELIPNTLAAKAKSFLDSLDKLRDYEDFFPLLPLPEVAKVYQTNDSFAEQRLSGANPLVIRLLDKDDPRSQVLRQIPSFEPAFEPLFDVPQELEDGNIYITDYTGTDHNYPGPSLVQGGTYEKGRKYLPKPLAFFWWKSIGVSDRGKLVPIAIQLPGTNANSRVYTPFEKNPLDWLFAKFCVQIADANHHEMSTHLCRTHFVMEPIAIGTAHQLADNHPLSILLRPHFLFMLTNNHLGQQLLINDNGSVDKVLAGTLLESMALVIDAYEGWNINEFSFPKEIANRRMDKIPHYPYRDDGMLVWNHLHTFVSSYLKHFYPTPQNIAEDTELQAWAAELSDQTTGGKVKGMPDQIATVSELIEIVTTVIFICGPQHSAVNYAQYEYMAFAANMPLSAYLNPNDSIDLKDPITPEKILQLLPPYKKAADQLQTLFILSAYRYERLGYYEKAFQELYKEKLDEIFFDDENQNNQVIVDIIKQFQQNLNMAEQEIDSNNKKRVVPYPYLKPSLVLNSISI
jgi:arachidonate 15-lipoxygenase